MLHGSDLMSRKRGERVHPTSRRTRDYEISPGSESSRAINYFPTFPSRGGGLKSRGLSKPRENLLLRFDEGSIFPQNFLSLFPSFGRKHRASFTLLLHNNVCCVTMHFLVAVEFGFWIFNNFAALGCELVLSNLNAN